MKLVVMSRRRELSFFVVIFCVLYGNEVLGWQTNVKPQILQTYETIIEANDNYTLFCQGNGPLKWIIPEVEEEHQRNWTTFISEHEKPVNKNYTHGLKLNIFHMTYPFIGFYRCQYEHADIEDEEETSKVYLFVNDPDHLTTLRLGDAITHIAVTQYKEAIIPCRPTSPDIKVTFMTFDGLPVMVDGFLPDSTIYRFDPLYGFFTNNTRDIHADHIYKCFFEKNGNWQNATVELDLENADYDPKTGFRFYVSDLEQQGTYYCTFIRESEVIAFIQLIIESTKYLSHLPKPYINDTSNGHTIIGNTLILECVVKSPNYVYFHWMTPTGPVDKSRMRTTFINRMERKKEILKIYNTTAADKGTYYCEVTDNQEHSSNCSLDVAIFGVNECSLTLKQEENLYSITATAGDAKINWSVTVKGHPEPSVVWLNNRNESITMTTDGKKYNAFYKPIDNTALLTIKNINIKDFGNYTLMASNNRTHDSVTLFLNVTDKPTVDLRVEPFYMVNTKRMVKCYAYAYPQPEIHWYFKGLEAGSQFTRINESIQAKGDGFEFLSIVTLSMTKPGYLKCFAKNFQGQDEDIKGVHISDVKNGFDIYGLDESVDIDEEQSLAVIARNDKISVTCGAAKPNYSEIYWTFNDIPLKDNDKYSIINSSTPYSNKVKLEVQHANFSDSGVYSCKAVNVSGDGIDIYKNLTFKVENPLPPVLMKTNLKNDMEMDLPDPLHLFCKFSGIPKPSLVWYKDGAVFRPSNSTTITVSANTEHIFFSRTSANNEGTYKCEGRNRMSIASRQQTVKFKNLPRTGPWLIVVIIFLTLICAGAIIFIVIKIRKEKRLQRELKLLGLANFEKGAVENINPELGIDDQAELLPYDQKWEFPIENLKLGKQLGSGAFGVVMKGVAKDIVDGEEQTTVAVKMVKKNAENTYIRALASELKIMVHLGKHLNVVNLLGACTKNVAKRELLVIVEFCRFGNIQNYLLRHRDNYIDQVDPKTGKIDYVIGQEFFSRTYSVSSDRSNAQSPSLKYAALTFSNSGNQPVLPPPSNMGDYRANVNTELPTATDMTTISQGEDGVILSNNSIQPEWRSNYKGDYKGNVKPICTKDLLAWAFQVARGMEYLASRKVLHGDLAARNILLADNNIVKICDFGLAKSMYKNDNYKKKGDGPLPVKWMAIESIRDRVFSTQSDVWSFGIVLWEFFSLARTPYPGMEADERLYQKLVDGYRMESPQFAPKEIYKMMTDCWTSKPIARPSFTKLSERLGNLLENSVRKHYIDLNDPYLVMNTQRLDDGQSDYLSMLSPPTFEALCTPHYVNEMVGQETQEDSGYLSMKPSTIFSPRVEDGPMFDFNVNHRKHLNSEEGNQMELLPMLQSPNDSGCETPLQSPTTPNSFSNPSYHIPPTIAEEKQNTNNNTEIVKSPDNYINMPQNKNIIKDKISNQSNPFIDSNNEKSNSHYVNSNSKDWESIKV